MTKYYFDNAATTALNPQVLEAMMPYFGGVFGNPSSIHSHGREARSAIERSRKTIAQLLNCSTSEIFFTSGGTEADNTAIIQAVNTLGLSHGITSKIEHHAVLHTMEYLVSQNDFQLDYVKIDKNGNIDFANLEQLLQTAPKGILSLMHANNEIGNIAQIDHIAELSHKYGWLYHSDTVQGIGHFKYDLQKTEIDFLAASAHKFHGPKGVGFMYISGRSKIQPYIHGGSQERNMRGGTENISGIVGMAKALELAYSNLEVDKKHILRLKKKLADGLQSQINGIDFNGTSGDIENSLFTVLNVSFPPSEKADMLLFNLDINKISASGGSACTSGTDIGSHVLKALGVDPARPSVRFSFSKYNTETEIDYLINKVCELVNN